MPTKPAFVVRDHGQTIWLDQIQRGWLTSGEFARLVRDEGVAGVTANPTIFDKAITGSSDYDAAIVALVEEGFVPGEIIERLMVQDLQQAADILRPAYDDAGGGDGFVSIEVSPELAYDTEGTITEVRRLWAALDRPNVMVKIPGTRPGLPAIEHMLVEGININITLLFSVARHEQVMEAYVAALERRLTEGRPIDRIRSVASFFVSRVDTLVDKMLDQRMKDADPAGRERLRALRSQVAIANTKVAYQRFKNTLRGPRWEALARHGAAIQRPLWGSTSTKDPTLPDTYYVETLIGPNTVDTVPLATLRAFNDHGRVAPTLEQGIEAAHQTLESLAEAGVDLTAVTDQLEADGVAAFADSFAALRRHIEEKRTPALAAMMARPRTPPRS